MRSEKSLVMLLIIALLCVMLSGCETYDNFYKEFFGEEEVKETIKIGIFEPLSGSDAPSAQDEINGMKLACKLHPEVLGEEIELVYADNQSGAETARAAAEELAATDVMMVLGSYKSVLTLAGGDVFFTAGIPMVGATCTNPIISQTNNIFFRACVTEEYQAKAAAEFVKGTLELDRAVVFSLEKDDSAQAIAEEFSASMSEGEVSKTLEVVYPKDAQGYTYYFDQMAAISAEAVYFPSSAEDAEAVIYDAYAQGYEFTWIGTARWEGLAEAARANGRETLEHLQTVYYTEDYMPDADLTEETEIFRQAYLEEYGVEATRAAALGYDAFMLAHKAIEKAGSTSVRNLFAMKLRQLRDYPLATGTISFDPQGDPIKDVIIVKLTDGTPSSVYTVGPVK